MAISPVTALVLVGLAVGIASAIFVTAKITYRPPSPGEYMTSYEEVRAFLNIYPNANMTSLYFDCVSQCPLYDFGYFHIDSSAAKSAKILVDARGPDKPTPNSFVIGCYSTRSEFEHMEIESSNVKEIAKFFQDERCPR